MKTGLLFTEVHDISLDRYGRLILEGDYEENKVKENEVLYIRYRFEEYTAEELRFIKRMLGQFEHTLHICDIDLNHDRLMEIYDTIKEYFGNKIAMFGRIILTDEDLITGSDNQLLLERLDGYNTNLIAKLDKVSLVDKTSQLNLQHIKAIEMKLFKTYGIKGVGICNSPFTNQTNCCLNALCVRELGAIYGDNETPVAVASHEGLNGHGCGCVRCVHIDYDIVGKEEKKEVTEKKEKKTSKENTNSTKSTKPKKTKNPTFVDFWI